MKEIKSSTKTLIEALRLIANGGINDPEGVTTATILESADRLEELHKENDYAEGFARGYKEGATKSRWQEKPNEVEATRKRPTSDW
jgi:hypothetical protein